MTKPELLKEFRFLFEDLQWATALHPPQEILEIYQEGRQPAGIDAARWQSQAISVHLGLCHPCRARLNQLQSKQGSRSSISKGGLHRL